MMFPSSMAFAEPLALWRDYLKQSSQPWSSYVLRDGTKLHLSDNPHDVITVMVNFCKRDYGLIEPGSVVVDIGANIGMFTMFAVRCGANAVYSYEPNRIAFDVMKKNVVENGLTGIVKPYQLAVAGGDAKVVYLPEVSSPYNRMSATSDGETNLVPVSATSLGEIFEENHLASVDYLKLDCEGAEYSILLQCSDDVLRRVRRIRMELHSSKEFSRHSVLERCLQAGFEVTYTRDLIYWLERR